MKKLAGYALFLVLTGCGGSMPNPGSDYAKNQRLQMQLDQVVADRNAQRKSLRNAQTEEDRQRLRSSIADQNSLIAQIKVLMGKPPEPVEPVEVESTSNSDAASATETSSQPLTIKRESSEFSKQIKLQAPATKMKTGSFEYVEWTPSALVSKEDGSVRYYVHFFEVYSGDRWRSWIAAATDRSETLAVNRLTSDVISCRGGCSYAEQISIDIPPEIAKRSSEKELRIQLRSRNASSFVFSTPYGYFDRLIEQANFESAKYNTGKLAAPENRRNPAVPDSAAAELEKLAKLKAEGVITDKEFQKLKAKIVGK